MSQTDDRRVRELFEQALSLPPEQRDPYLEEACAGDAILHAEVKDLLAFDASAGDFLEASAAEIAPDALLGPESTLTGKRIGPYRLLRPIGAGGMATVYVGERADGAYQKRVAVKVLAGDPARTDFERRFLTERQILARLEHPNIARLLDGGTTEAGFSYLVMEYVEGKPLDAYANEHELDVEDRIELFLEVCAAVQYMHRHLIIHRDLKPSNVLVGPDRVPKLLDFGIAKILAVAGHRRDSRRTTGRILTPAYASPEQLRGLPLTTATDVYSLGVLLFELLTGRLPVPEDEWRHFLEGKQPVRTPLPSEVVCAPHDGAHPSRAPAAVGHATPESLRRTLSGDLDTIVCRALDRDPEHRFASVEQMADDLRRHLDGVPIRSRPPTVLYRAEKFVRRHRMAVATTISLVISLAIVSIIATSQSVRLARERVAAEEARARADQERARAEAVTGVLVRSFQSADPNRSGQGDVPAKQLLAEGARQASQLTDQPETRAAVLESIGAAYRGLAMYDEASEYLEEALQGWMASAGPQDPRTAASQRELAELALETGDLDRARELAQSAMDIFVHVSGPESKGTADCLRILGMVNASAGHYEEAERQAKDALRIHEADSTSDDSAVGADLGVLTYALYGQGRYAEGVAPARRALELARKTYGEVHPEVGGALNDLATMVELAGDPAAAEDLYRQSLAIDEETLGDDHPDVATDLNNLGLLLQDLARPEEAVPMLRRALQIRQRAFSDDHPLLALSLNNLALALIDVREFDEAESLLQEAVTVRRRQTKQGAAWDANELNNLGLLFRRKGDMARAERFYREALEIRRANLGEDHPWVAQTLQNIAIVLRIRGDRAQAIDLLREAMEIRRRSLGTDHPEFASSESALARVLVDDGEYAEAESLARHALRIYESSLGTDHWRTELVRTALGASLFEQGRREEGRRLLKDAYEALRSSVGDEATSTQEAKRRLDAVDAAGQR